MNDPIRRPRQPAKAVPTRIERMDSEEFIQLLRQNVWLILAVVAMVMGATAWYLSRQTPTYTAQSAMALTNSEVRISQVDTQMEVYDLTRARVETELDRLRSRNFAEDVAKSLNLFGNTEFLPLSENGPPLDSIERGRAVIDKLLGSYSLQRTGESLVISIMAEAEQPQLAADIANGVVNSFIALSVAQQVSDLENYDAVIVGAGTRYGTVASQMRNFWDQTGGVWFQGKLVGKVGSVFTSTATQHGGQETTLIGMIQTLLHHGIPHFENNYAHRGQPIISPGVVRDFSDRGHLSWEHLTRIRRRWKGHLVVKGLLQERDALKARELGADALVLSNHGGRQLDGAVPAMRVIERIATACGDLPVLLDGGIRSVGRHW